MKVIRRNEETNDIDEKSPFLEHSIPVTRSPKVSGAGVQLSFRVAKLKIFIALFEDFFWVVFLTGSEFLAGLADSNHKLLQRKMTMVQL